MVAITCLNRTVNIEQWHENNDTKLVCLHGFTGTAKSWGELAHYLPDVHVIAIDLIGHGMSDVPENASEYEMNVQLQLLEQVFQQLKLDRFTLLGYSMGGRIALSYAVQHPTRVEQLLLESASPGLVEESERQARIVSDHALADFIEREGLEAFVEKWANIPLFETQKQLPKDVQQGIRTERLSQHPLGLANSLRGIGTGRMPSVWNQLSTISMPVHLLVGELDVKFVKIANEMKKQIANVQITQFLGCGHTIHVENLPQFATIVKES
ncbi:MAG: 2-succinyl-6-hydroxy-2,4-cyclohexadiene-1-carboxylate synthase, partial [Lysinibacillus sp.]